MSSSELARLRNSLRELQSCELPANHRHIDHVDKENGDPNAADKNDNDNGDAKNGAVKSKSSNEDNGDDGIYDPQLLQRYKSARDSYIQQRTMEQFLSSLQNYNAETNTLPLPDDATSEQDREALAQRQQEVLDLVKGTMARVTEGVDGVRLKWEHFVEKREELVQIVEGMERSERSRRLEEGDGNDNVNDEGENDNDELGEGCSKGEHEDDEEITEDDVTFQEEKLDELRRRKLELENRLRSVRAQTLDVEDDCHRSKRVVNEVRVRGGLKPLDWRGLDGGSNVNDNGNAESNAKYMQDNVDNISAVAEGIHAEIADAKEKTAEMKESCVFYDNIKELLEELGGIKILSSESVPVSKTSNGSASSDDDKDSEASPEKRQKLQEEGFALTLMLLGSHVLEITLTKSSTDKDGLQVSNAQLTTPTTYPVPEITNDSMEIEETTTLMETMHSVSLSNASFSKIMSQKPSEEVSIPPLKDLVAWSRQLESSSQGIRFVLVETLARLRTMEARVYELGTLREKYAAQVYDVESPSSEAGDGYGGAEQEVVCAINEGITLALKLGADCPLVPGSVYISEMIGMGGWEESKLEELKELVADRRCRGPVEVMEIIAKEVRRRRKEEGWEVPATPCLPRGKS